MSNKLEAILQLVEQLDREERIELIHHITQSLLDSGDISDAEDLHKKETTRRYFPRIPQMIEWELLHPGEDTVYIEGEEQTSKALLYNEKEVVFNGKRMPINEWAKQITGWSSVNIYRQVVLERNGKTLDAIRREYMEKNNRE